jgi:hypothetical protein
MSPSTACRARSTLLCIAAFAALLFGPASPARAQADTAALIEAVDPQVIGWRRHLHQYPELSYQEEKTAAYVAQALRAMPGIEVQTGIAKTGVKAVLKGGSPGPVIALRADMDALPVEERNDLPFRSQAKATWQGKETPVMHACGYDAQVAILLLNATREDNTGCVAMARVPVVSDRHRRREPLRRNASGATWPRARRPCARRDGRWRRRREGRRAT